MLKQNLNVLNDPWKLLDRELRSKHCESKKSRILMYDHTGAVQAKCECGILYWHDEGAYK